MRHSVMSVTTAKAKLLELTRKLDDNGEAFVLTRDGQPVGALISMSEYEAWLETLDVENNVGTLSLLKKALNEADQGRLWKRDSKGKWTKIKV